MAPARRAGQASTRDDALAAARPAASRGAASCAPARTRDAPPPHPRVTVPMIITPRERPGQKAAASGRAIGGGYCCYVGSSQRDACDCTPRVRGDDLVMPAVMGRKLR
jgi:hypothetical protein